MKKRILALVLTLAMLLSLFPGQVFATETETEHTEHNFVEVQPETETPTELPDATETETPTELPDATEELTETPTEDITETPTEPREEQVAVTPQNPIEGVTVPSVEEELSGTVGQIEATPKADEGHNHCLLSHDCLDGKAFGKDCSHYKNYIGIDTQWFVDIVKGKTVAGVLYNKVNKILYLGTTQTVSFYLKGKVTLPDSIDIIVIKPNVTPKDDDELAVNLCLNGFQLDLTGRQIQVSDYGDLRISDCKLNDTEQGKIVSAYDGSTIRVYANGILRLYDGTVENIREKGENDLCAVYSTGTIYAFDTTVKNPVLGLYSVGGTSVIHGGHFQGQSAIYQRNNSGQLTIENGTFENGEVTSASDSTLLIAGGTVDISGGTISSKDGRAIHATGGKLNISGGAIESEYLHTVHIDGAEVNITGGSIIHDRPEGVDEPLDENNEVDHQYALCMKKGTLTVNGENVVIDGKRDTALFIGAEVRATLTDGFISTAGSGMHGLYNKGITEINGPVFIDSDHYGIFNDLGTADLSITAGTIYGYTGINNKNSATLKLSGSPNIQSHKNGVDIALSASGENFITINGTLTPAGDGIISVTKMPDPTLGSPVQFTLDWEPSECNKDVFTSIVDGYGVRLTEDKEELALTVIHGHTLANDGTGATVEFNYALTAAKLTNNLTLPAGDYVLTGDLSLNNGMKINGHVRLCLNGYKLDLGSSQIQVTNSGILEICDCNGSGNGQGMITSNIYGAVIDATYGTVNLYSGTLQNTYVNDTIPDNDTDNTEPVNTVIFGKCGVNIYGGVIRSSARNAIRVTSGGLYISGGEIVQTGPRNSAIFITHDATQEVSVVGGNIQSEYYGIVFNLGKSLTIEGSATRIVGSTAVRVDHAVATITGGYLEGTINNAITINNDGQVTVNGPVTLVGKVKGIGANSPNSKLTVSDGNISSKTDYGIYTKGTLTLTGGTVSATTDTNGYGVYVEDGTFNLSGAPTITGAIADIYLAESKLINVEVLTGSEHYSVLTEKTASIETPEGGISIQITEGFKQNGNSNNLFESVNPAYISLVRNDEVYFVTKSPITVQVVGNGSAFAKDENGNLITKALEDDTVVIDATPNAGNFTGRLVLTYMEGEKEVTTELRPNANGDFTFTMPGADVTATVYFYEKHIHTLADGTKVEYNIVLTQALLNNYKDDGAPMPAGNYVLLEGEVSAPGKLTVSGGANVNICLCGNKMTVPSQFYVLNSTVRINDCTGTGTFTTYDYIYPNGSTAHVTLADANFVIATRGNNTSSAALLFNGGASFTMESGTFTTPVKMVDYMWWGNHKIYIMGGTFYGAPSEGFLTEGSGSNRAGTIYLSGSPVFRTDGVNIGTTGNYFTFESGKPLMPNGETYTFYLGTNPSAANPEVQFTSGWAYSGLSSNDNEFAKIPFVNRDGYAVREIDKNGVKELYLVLPEVTGKVVGLDGVENPALGTLTFTDANGNASTGGKKGTMVYISPEATEGYVLATLVATWWNGSEMETLTLEKNADGKYAMEMPAADVTVIAKFVEPHVHDNGMTFATPIYAAAGETVDIYEYIKDGGYFYLAGEGKFVLDHDINSEKVPQDLYLCLYGHELTVGQLELHHNLYICDCNGGVLHQTDYWQIQNGNLTFYNLTVDSTPKNADFSTFYVFKGTKFLIENSNITGTSNKKLIGYYDFGATVEIKNSTVYNKGAGVAVHEEVPTLILSGNSVTGADNNAAILINKKYDPNTKMTIDPTFNPGEGGSRPTSSVLVENYTVDPIFEPIQITTGWSVAKEQNGIDYIPFTSYDENYIVFEMDGELWIGKPHFHYDNDGNIIEIFPKALTNDTIGQLGGGLWKEGNYYLLDNVTYTTTDQINLAGDVHLCLNDLKIENGTAHFQIESGYTLTIEDCGDEGVARFYSYRVNCGKLNLLGGTIRAWDDAGGFATKFQNVPGDAEIIVNGATLVLENSRDKDSPTLYGHGGGNIHMISGVIRNDAGRGSALMLYDGTYQMQGDMTLTGTPNAADIYVHNRSKFIEITGALYVPENETYTIELATPLANSEDKYKVTENWANAGLNYIPFVSTQGYASVLIDGEVYLVMPSVTCVEVPDEGGELIASEYLTTGNSGEKIYVLATKNKIVTLTPTPAPGWVCTGVTYSYTLLTEKEPQYHEAVITPNASGIYFFFMPAAHVTATATFEKLDVEKPLNLYLWKDHQVMVTGADLLEGLRDCDPNHYYFTEDGSYTITDVTIEGLEKVVFESAEGKYSFLGTVAKQTTGKFRITYTDNATGKTETAVGVIKANVFDVKDSLYVLDYAKAVKISDGLFAQDTLPGVKDGEVNVLFEAFAKDKPDMAPDGLTMTIHPNDGNGTYGKFSVNSAGEAVYTPTDGVMLEGADKIFGVFRVYDKDADASNVGVINPFREAEMYKQITVLPANVVYYEDDNSALKWKKDSKDITIEIIGSSSGYQDGDNNSEYGNDSDYTNAPEDLDKYVGSGGVTTKITVKGSQEVLSFTFKGTGFDVIGSTTADSGQLIYQVFKIEKDANGKQTEVNVKTAALNTVYNGSGEAGPAIYEVPLIHVMDLPHGTYKVVIRSVASYDWSGITKPVPGQLPPVKETYLYFDGVRIYNPIAEGSTERENYLEGERTAKFVQVRNMILNGQAAVAKIDENGNLNYSSALISYVEKAQPGLKFQYQGNAVSSLNDYLVAGPNNEVYFNQNTQTLVFYVKETAAEDGAPMLQLAIRNLNPEAFDKAENDGYAPKIDLLGADGKIYNLVSDGEAISYTEQYYTINYKACAVEEIDGTNYYRVVISARNDSAFAMTNLKVSGLEFHTNPNSVATLHYNEYGVLVDTTATETVAFAMPNLYLLARQLMAANHMLPEDELPGQAAELTFRSVSLSLQSSIGMNLYVAKQTLQGYVDPFVRLTKTVYDETGKASNVTVDIYDYEEVQVQGQDCIRFFYGDIAAKEMGSNVHMELMATDSNLLRVMEGENRDYSVVQYAKNMMEKNLPAQFKTLLVDMVNYGAEAQAHFRYNTANPANAGFEAYQHLATVAQPNMVSCTNKDSVNELAPMPEGVGYLTKVAGASLVLEDKVKVNLFVDVKDGSGQDNLGRTVKVAYADVTGTTVVEDVVIAASHLDSAGKYYRVTFDGLHATDMRTAFMAWVVNAEGVRISNTMTYSIESYGASVMSGTASAYIAMQPLVVAMMKYGDSAKAYFSNSK